MKVKKEYATTRASINQRDSTNCQNPIKRQKLSTDIEDVVDYDEAAKNNLGNNNYEITQ